MMNKSLTWEPPSSDEEAARRIVDFPTERAELPPNRSSVVALKSRAWGAPRESNNCPNALMFL